MELLSAIATAASWAETAVRAAKQHRDDQIRLRCQLSALESVELLQELGSTAIAVRVINDGVRPAKIAVVKLRVHGTGYLKRIAAGFDESFDYDPIDHPTLGREMLEIKLTPVSPPTHTNGWVLERDDACILLFAVGTPVSNFFLDAKTVDVEIVAEFFSGDVQNIADGQLLIGLLTPMFERCVKRGWRHHGDCEVAVRTLSKTLGRNPVPGVVNSKNINMTEDDAMMHMGNMRTEIVVPKWIRTPRRRRRLNADSELEG